MPLDPTAAGRLLALLEGLTRHAGLTLRGAWSEVLGVPVDDVQYGESGLPLVARVLDRAVEEAHRATEDTDIEFRDDLIVEWRKPVYIPNATLDSGAQQYLPHPEALRYLTNVARITQRNDRRPELPEPDDLSDLLDQVDGLGRSVEESEELPDDARRAILRRINQLRSAIQLVRVGGAEGVQDAVEQLVGALAVRAATVPKPLGQRILTVARKALVVFMAGTVIQASIGAWSDMGESLMEAVDHIDGEATEEDEPANPEQRKPPGEQRASPDHER